MRQIGYLCMSCWALCRDKTAEWISFRWFISFPHWAHRLSNPGAKFWRTLFCITNSGSPSKWLAVIKLTQPGGTLSEVNMGRRRHETGSSTLKTQVSGTGPVTLLRAFFQLSENNFCSKLPSWGEENEVLTPAFISETFKVTPNKGWEKRMKI